MKYTIPSRFVLGKQDWLVTLSERSATCYGRTWYDSQHIVLHMQSRGRPVRHATTARTFWHEATHAILHSMGHPLYNDEKFVEQFSGRLFQLITTAKF